MRRTKLDPASVRLRELGARLLDLEATIRQC